MALATDDRLGDLLDSYVDDARLVHVEHLPARAPTFAEPARPLPAVLRARLPGPALYRHQAEAIDLLREGQSVVVATGTGSGKSLCYQLPIAEAVTTTPPATALVVVPTKALAQDQLRAFGALGIPGLVAATYDGDTSTVQRGWVRRHADVVFTNPEMLHHGMLAHHPRWATFLKRLRFIVVDELHLLRGVFGSHVAHVLRRLRRLCAHYGAAAPTFVFASATIGRPESLARELCGLEVTPVVQDGSATGPREFVLWNAHRHHPGDVVQHTPSLSQTCAAIASQVVRAGHRTIVFARSRAGAEVTAEALRRALPARLASGVRTYRAGYLAEERRSIELELFEGRLSAVVATTALELGIDVAGLDACVLGGFPGTLASFWQQSGRAGRGTDPALCVLVAGDDQLDQWFMANPRELFDRPPEPAVVNVANPFILKPHLRCAADERPLDHSDERYWPGLLDDAVRELVLDGELVVRRGGRGSGPRAAWVGGGPPGHRIGLRSASAAEVRIVTVDGTLIGTVDEGRAVRVVHPGAVYLHQGQAWRILELDLRARRCLAEPDDGTEHTRTLATTELFVLGNERTRPVGAAQLANGPVRVVHRVTGYRRIEARTGRLLGAVRLDLPPGELTTRALWYTFDDEVLERAGLEREGCAGALHAVEHAAIGLLPLFTICDRSDVGGVSTPLLADTGAPTVAIYDGFPGGAGVAELGYDAADRHLDATRRAIGACECATGCPSCIQSPKCGNGNEPLDKAGAIRLLDVVLAAPH